MEVTPQAVAHWERSNPKFDIDKSYILANLLDVDIEWLNGKKGTDDEVIVSGLSSSFKGRAPIIPKEHVVLFAIFNRSNFRPHEYEETLEPTAKVQGQAFAIRLVSDDEFPPLFKDDILIFDNGRSAKAGEAVVAISVDTHIRTVFAMCVVDEVKNSSGDDTLALVAPPETESENIMEKLGGATPVAVLIEIRSFKSPERSLEKASR